MSNENIMGATKEIVVIMRKRELVGVFILANSEEISHYTKLDAPWSCATYDGETVRVSSEPGFTTPESKAKAIKSTVGMIIGISDCCRFLQEELGKVIDTLAKQVSVSHTTREIKPRGR